MKLKYNLALIPQIKSEAFLRVAHQFSDIADQYLLGKKSNPHVTLYQFEMEENEVNRIWARVCEGWETKPVTLEFNKFDCRTFDDLTNWASLLPDQRIILHKMHHRIADLLGLPVKAVFDPHVTLFNSKNKEYEQKVARLFLSYNKIIDTFVLCLGRSDAVGQLIEILYRYEPS